MKPNMKCEICGKNCHTAGGLGVHMKTSHPDQWQKKPGYVPKRPQARKRIPRRLQCIVVAHFCPQCGLNLQVLNAAMTVANHHNP